MTDAQLINAICYRKLKDGQQYANLIPKPLGVQNTIEQGNELSDTYDTLEIMASVVSKYGSQFSKVAETLIGSSVPETIQNNFQFLHDHFQYKIDESPLDQKLYAPAQAWAARKTGFDCKTYSLLASCLLVCQGIFDHSFRMVEMVAGEGWSHVYVVVNHNNREYVIDATLHQNKEVSPIIEKHDYSMKHLKHQVLAAPILAYSSLSCGCTDTQSLSSPIAYNGGQDDIYPPIQYPQNTLGAINLDSFEDISFDSLESLFSSIKCWGGTAFDANKVKVLSKTIIEYYTNFINRYNNAIEAGNFSQVHKIYVEYWLKRHAMILTYIAKKQSKDWNSCSDASFDFIIDLLDNKIHKVLGMAFEKHIVTNFNLGARNQVMNFTHPANSGDIFDNVYMWGTQLSKSIVADVHYYTLDVTPKKDTILAFQITPELETAINSNVQSSTFDTTGFLNDLVQMGAVAYQQSQSSGGFTIPDLVFDANNPRPRGTQFPTSGSSDSASTGSTLLKVGAVAAVALVAYQGVKKYNSKK